MKLKLLCTVKLGPEKVVPAGVIELDDATVKGLPADVWEPVKLSTPSAQPEKPASKPSTQPEKPK